MRSGGFSGVIKKVKNAKIRVYAADFMGLWGCGGDFKGGGDPFGGFKSLICYIDC